MDTDPDKWFYDKVNENLTQLHRYQEILYSGRSQFQSIDVIRSGNFGKCLVLDGKIQSTDADEFIYHEALVQPAMITHPCPRTVLIAGGGEGSTLREVLVHDMVERAVMIDIDADVVNICQQYLPEHNCGSFVDRRAEVLHTDAREYLAKSREKFDVIIIDLPDPIEEGPAYLLYTQEFYHIVRDKLTADGVITVQAGSASLNELLNLSAVHNTLRSVFPIVCPYQTDVPCFGGPWGFCLASVSLDPRLLSIAEVDCRISARKIERLRFYDGITHQGVFALPKYLRDRLAQPTRLITDKEPLYIYRG